MNIQPIKGGAVNSSFKVKALIAIGLFCSLFFISSLLWDTRAFVNRHETVVTLKETSNKLQSVNRSLDNLRVLSGTMGSSNPKIAAKYEDKRLDLEKQKATLRTKQETLQTDLLGIPKNWKGMFLEALHYLVAIFVCGIHLYVSTRMLPHLERQIVYLEGVTIRLSNDRATAEHKLDDCTKAIQELRSKQGQIEIAEQT